MPKMAVDNGIESSEFYGNKILLMKQPDHSAWNNAFKATLKSLLRKINLFLILNLANCLCFLMKK